MRRALGIRAAQRFLAVPQAATQCAQRIRRALRQAPVIFGWAAIPLLASCGEADRPLDTGDAYTSIVSRGGDIRFPEGFPEGFMFIGTWAVDAQDGHKEVHSVYSRPADVVAFHNDGKFPDGAVLVKEVLGMKGSDFTTGQAYWAGGRKTWFVMIKDRKQRFIGNPLWGDGWGWAQFDPSDLGKQTARNYKTDCRTCHLPARSSDWVYTFAYPALGPRGRVNIPSSYDAYAEKTPGSKSGGSEDSKMLTDASAGKATFETYCGACHSATPGGSGVGPTLAGVIGRKAGTVPRYDYSAAMRKSGVVWTPENIGRHLETPRTFIPDNRMGNLFPKGIQDPDQRKQIIAYLETLG